MKVLFVNTFCGIKSTGRICTDFIRKFEEEGHICRIAYGREPIDEHYRDITYHVGSEIGVRLHGIKSRITDKHGLYSKSATKKFLEWADSYNPDLLWLHNLHGYYLNYEMLFAWIKSRHGMQVKWTLHDCWAFTGHCAYFTKAGCEKWRKQCFACEQSRSYPASYFKDGSKENFIRKKRAFCGVENLTILIPSYWMANLVANSFLGNYPLEVHYNKIDKAVFKPTPNRFKEKMNILDRFMLLGVATDWDERKGLSDFLQLSKMLDDSYQIVLVGLKPKQIKRLPSNVIGIVRTDSKEELAQIYTAADIFVNPSKEETFGMTTLEALNCGTQAIVYEGTACEEVAKKYGGIVAKQDVKMLYQTIVELKAKSISEGNNS